MNPVLILLILIGAVILWFLLSGFFIDIGKFTNFFVDGTKDVMFKEDEEKEKEDNEET